MKKELALIMSFLLMITQMPNVAYAQETSAGVSSGEVSSDSDEVYLNEMVKEYYSESGMHVYIPNLMFYLKDMVEVTDQDTIDMYLDIAGYNSDAIIGPCRKDKEHIKLYAYDKVVQDNSSVLNDQMYFLTCVTSSLEIVLNENVTSDEIAAYLNETYKPRDLSINLYNIKHSNIIRLAGNHYLTLELAEKINRDLSEKGIVDSSEFIGSETPGMSDYKGLLSGIYYPFIYPESAADEIKKIISETGLNVDIEKYEKINNFITLKFYDYKNTTQMDVVNLRTKIFKETGLKGKASEDGYVPQYKGSLQFGLTDSVARAGSVTYLDITLGQNTGFCTFITQLDYDHDVFELVSASLKNNFSDIADFHIDNDTMLLMSKNSKNIELNEQDAIRLAFKVKDTAPDGKYEIKISAPEGEETGVCSNNGEDAEWINSEFSSGSIIVDSQNEPKTKLKPVSLHRMYASVTSGELTRESSVTGDTNNDGNINVMDVMRMNRYFLGADETIENADVNEDGIVNITDMIILRGYLIE